MIFESEIELKLFLKLKMCKYLTSDSFYNPDREYIYLDKDNIKLMRMDPVI